MGDKVFWIGDDADFKCIKAGSRIIGRGEEIPAGTLSDERIKEFREKGLISIGDKAAPVVIRDTETIKNLETEIISLKRDLDVLPGLRREIAGLKKSAEKSKDGAKARRVKELEDIVIERDKKITALDLDNQEKAALIDKLNADIEAFTKPHDGGAGPGGGK